jgi:hypothetical protein
LWEVKESLVGMRRANVGSASALEYDLEFAYVLRTNRDKMKATSNFWLRGSRVGAIGKVIREILASYRFTGQA